MWAGYWFTDATVVASTTSVSSTVSLSPSTANNGGVQASVGEGQSTEDVQIFLSVALLLLHVCFIIFMLGVIFRQKISEIGLRKQYVALDRCIKCCPRMVRPAKNMLAAQAGELPGAFRPRNTILEMHDNPLHPQYKSQTPAI